MTTNEELLTRVLDQVEREINAEAEQAAEQKRLEDRMQTLQPELDALSAECMKMYKAPSRYREQLAVKQKRLDEIMRELDSMKPKAAAANTSRFYGISSVPREANLRSGH